MDYIVDIRPQAVRDLAGLDRQVASRILRKIERLSRNLSGDVKRLTNHEVGFRLRVGDYRVLFDVMGTKAIIQYVRHRREAY
jgi:mRNA interferase RelE/StbE